MSVSLKDQVVLVVGASSGIGRETAVLFAREGAKVIASARREDRLNQLRDELRGQGHTIDVHAADASKVDDMARLAEFTRSTFGPPDVVVYVTGTNTPDRALTRLTPQIWDELVNVNLNGAYYLTHAVLPEMRSRKSGHFIYISSVSGQVPDISGAAYQASKRGMIGLAHAIRVEERENNIRTCALCPGLVETEILEKRPVKPSPEQLAKALQPEDIAEAVLFVAKLHPRAAVPEMQFMPATL